MTFCSILVADLSLWVESGWRCRAAAALLLCYFAANWHKQKAPQTLTSVCSLQPCHTYDANQCSNLMALCLPPLPPARGPPAPLDCLTVDRALNRPHAPSIGRALGPNSHMLTNLPSNIAGRLDWSCVAPADFYRLRCSHEQLLARQSALKNFCGSFNSAHSSNPVTKHQLDELTTHTSHHNNNTTKRLAIQGVADRSLSSWIKWRTRPPRPQRPTQTSPRP